MSRNDSGSGAGAIVTPPRVFDISQSPYNAVADSFYFDGVATGSSTTFTSATANFTSADVGKTIVVLKAGPSQFQDLHTTIASVTNSTTVVLANSAQRSQSSCRFYVSRGGDSTTAIQTAINNAAAAGGGTVFCPGVGYLVTGLTLKNRVRLVGNGRNATMIHLAAQSNVPVVTNDQTANDYAQWCSVEQVRIDGNRARQTDITTTLASGYTAGATTLSLTDASAFQFCGSVLIGTNRLLYAGKSGNTLQNVFGGREGTADANALSGATVTQHNSHGISFCSNPYNTNPTLTESGDSYFLVEDVFVRNCHGDGIQNWGLSGMRYAGCVVQYADHFGIRPSFDAWIENCDVSNVGRACYFIGNSDVRASNCKAWFAGGNVASEGYGWFLEGLPVLEEGTKVLAACTAQDNKADGFYLRNAQRCSIQGLASTNGTSAAGTYVGIKIDGSTSGNIDLICTDRTASPNTTQLNAINLLGTTFTPTALNIRIQHAAAVGASVGTAVKSGSIINGGVNLQVNGMGSAMVETFAASYTPDPYAATAHVMTMTGNVTALNAPSNGHYGCPLELHFVQDGTGSRTLGGVNAIYKFAGASAPTLTTTANRRDIFRFMFDGTNWIETSRATNVG